MLNQVVCAGAFLFGNELSDGPDCVLSVTPSGVPFGNFKLERSGLGRMITHRMTAKRIV